MAGLKNMQNKLLELENLIGDSRDLSDSVNNLETLVRKIENTVNDLKPYTTNQGTVVITATLSDARTIRQEIQSRFDVYPAAYLMRLEENRLDGSLFINVIEMKFMLPDDLLPPTSEIQLIATLTDSAQVKTYVTSNTFYDNQHNCIVCFDFDKPVSFGEMQLIVELYTNP